MNNTHNKRTAYFFFTVLIFLSLVACGSGSSDGDMPTDDGTPPNRNFTLPDQGLNRSVSSIALAADSSGDVYLGGSFTNYNDSASNYIIRLNSDGTVDSGFVVGSGFDGAVYTIVPAADGSGDIYVGGQFTSYQGTACSNIVRLNNDGSIDGNFSVGSGFDDVVNAIATDGFGNIYVGGWFANYNGTGSNHIIRLDSSGSVDGTFVVGAGFDSVVYTIAKSVDGSGDIYVGGGFTTYKGNGYNAIVRLDSYGAEVGSFAVGSGFDSSVTSIMPATDGTNDVYVSGMFTAYQGSGSNYIIRLNSNGTTDTNFATGGGFGSPANDIIIATDSSGDIYVSGGFSSYDGNNSNGIIRINNDGSVDGAFSAGTGLNLTATAAAPTDDGSGDIYLGGSFTSYNGTVSNHLIRIASDGTTSQSYSSSAGMTGTVKTMVLTDDSSGDIYVGGLLSTYNGNLISDIIQLNSDGTIDNGLSLGYGFVSGINTVAIAEDGSGDIYAGGTFTTFNANSTNRIVRLDSNGTRDVTFAVGSGFNSGVNMITPANDGTGDIYVGGIFTTYQGLGCSRIVKITGSGTRNSGFALGTGFDFGVNAIARATDSSSDIYVGGQFTSYQGATYNRIIRLKGDGSVVAGFAVGNAFDATVNTVVPAADGSGDIYVGGMFTSYQGVTHNRLIRLKIDGSVESSFVTGSGFDGDINTIALAADGSGDIYVGGKFTSYKGAAYNRIVRLNSDGSVDTGFVVDNGFDSDVNSIIPAADGTGDLYVGGAFTTYRDTTAMGIVALNPDGSID